MPSVQLDYPAAWREYRRRNFAALASPVVALPGGVAIGLALTQRFGADVPIVVAMLLHLTVTLPCFFRLSRWRCPRCGNRFHQLGERFYYMFARQCCTCGLPLREGRRAAVAGRVNMG